jgi:N-acetyl-gamma-glutamyl-phosphate reductase
MYKVAVIGASGYAGAELVRILSGHPQVELACLCCRSDAGDRFDHIYPALSGWTDLICEAYDPEHLVAQSVDAAFIALPHQVPMGIVPQLLDAGIRVIDLSADFRFKDAAVYEAHYQEHTSAHLLASSVYGLSEIYSDDIANARLIGNPGCYPTSVLLPLIPLLKAGLVETKGLIADAKSGVSGAGRSPSLTTHFCQVNESFKAYKVGGHRHTPEIEAILSEQAGDHVPLTFVPHLVPMSRGMQTTIYAGMKASATEADVLECLQDSYQGRPFVRMRGHQPPDTLHVKGTNCIDIGLRVDTHNHHLVLMSAIDNLVKGAAGQAVQNMNIMLGLDETAGLGNPAFPM